METRMELLVKLIRILEDRTLSDRYKVNEICYLRDHGIITDEEGVDLVILYSLNICAHEL